MVWAAAVRADGAGHLLSFMRVENISTTTTYNLQLQLSLILTLILHHEMLVQK